MNQFCVLPLSLLRPYIDRLWGWESEPGEIVALPTLLPGTGAELYFHYRTPFYSLTQVGSNESCGPMHLFCLRQRPISLAPAAYLGFIAVRFRVGMIHRFTNIPASELGDQVLSAEALWGTPGARLTRQFGEAESRSARVVLIQQFLCGQLRQESADALIERAAGCVYHLASETLIGGLIETFGLGRRQFERRFTRFAGVSPGELKGLTRFQRTVRTLMLYPSTESAQVALDHGYYDQSHFIRDFRDRVGEPPGRFVAAARQKTHFYNTSFRETGTLRTPD